MKRLKRGDASRKGKIDPHFLAYLELLRVIMRKRSLSRDARTLYVYLLTYENLKTNQAKPGQRTICRDLRLSPNTLQGLLDELYERSLILLDKEPKKNGNLTVYTLIAPQPDVSSNSPNVVPFPSQNSTNSTSSTTPSDGSLDSISGQKHHHCVQSRPLSQG